MSSFINCSEPATQKGCLPFDTAIKHAQQIDDVAHQGNISKFGNYCAGRRSDVSGRTYGKRTENVN